ncbi:CopD family protein [Sphingomonas immobilis]|uniref:Protoporphyrinogen IX oxidase n=1 Tax=Sphingomonas immobilis TaxID=3063997 RepID=A0ABT8ZUZ6_9SPHN|nr:CopD family protein [Sphingomonas sp. CA1-15]MDO7841407.1 CopD family protein [Sphingomonas sp. CA1-15]
MNFLGNAYLWAKAAHVIFVIFWMAGLFLLPRYLVYHQEALGNSAEEAKWVERETKLRKIILNPSMAIVWILGLMLAANAGLFSGVEGLGWLHAKLALVVILSGYHGWAVGYAKKLAAGKPRLSGKALRMINEVPAILVTLIVILVIVRPF